MLMPYFSKASIARLCPSLEEKIRTLIGQLENFALKGKEGKGGDVDMSRAYACLTCDAIMDYCYGRAGGALQAPGFEYAFTEGLEVMSANGRWDKYVRRLGVVVLRLMLVMPVQVVEMVSAPMGLVRVWVDVCSFPFFVSIGLVWWRRADQDKTCRRTILEQKKKRKGNGEGEGERRESTVFDNLLNPNAEKGQSIPSDHDLTAEAVTVLSAGLGTTATALTLTTWYILTTPGVLTKLVRELRDAVPDKDVMPSLAALEKLPYLVSVFSSLPCFLGEIRAHSNCISTPRSKKAFVSPQAYQEDFPASSLSPGRGSAVKIFLPGYALSTITSQCIDRCK